MWFHKGPLRILGFSVYIILFLLTCLTFTLILFRYQNQENLMQPTVPIQYSHFPNNSTIVPLLINNLVCSSDEPVRLLILITSHAGNIELRKRVRKAVPNHELKRMQMRRLFLLAHPRNNLESNPKYKNVAFEEIEQESKTYKDVIVGNFVESYRNLTFKHLMGLEWTTKYCYHAKFVIKQDDDIVVDYYQFDELLLRPPFSLAQWKRVIIGKVLEHQPIVRDPKSKWYVSYKEISDVEFFPSFVSGWAYITNPKVIQALVNEARKQPFFWIDDEWITGNLREAAGVELLDFSPYFTVHKGQLQCCIATPRSLRSRGTARFPYWCDYLVGPSNDDLDLLELMYSHARFCYKSKTCRRREGRKTLDTTCVITPDMVVNNFAIGSSKGGATNNASGSVSLIIPKRYG